MKRKPIQVDEFTHEVFRLEVRRMSKKKTLSMLKGLRSLAEKLNKKHGFGVEN